MKYRTYFNKSIELIAAFAASPHVIPSEEIKILSDEIKIPSEENKIPSGENKITDGVFCCKKKREATLEACFPNCLSII